MSSRGSVSPRSVLLVEDDEASQYILATLLRHVGYHTLVARTAAAAMKILERQPPDLVIMDIGLPGVDGFALTERIRSDPRTRDLPVLVVTVHVFPEDIQRAAQAGCTGFMAKPVDPLAVVARVKSLIGPPPPVDD
jgi:CheY-like chemotaxis protein